MGGLQVFAVALAAILMMAAGQDLDAFPEGFMFGTATASYQIEGAWDTNGKGENIWDNFTHSRPEMIADGSNGDIAADSYNKWQDDINLLNEMNMKVYRFSISWSRILPTGGIGKINPDGLDYYNKVIDALLDNGITPLVTMYHWDLPQPLQDIGGWQNEELVDYFLAYARVLYENFGDRVKWWITFNEPAETCRGYAEGGTAPGLTDAGVADYKVAHTIIKSHARAWHLYDDEYRQTQQGKVSITLNSGWSEPETDSPEDAIASQTAMNFFLGWFAHPIFSAEGNYPAVMIENVAANSAAEGLAESRLPVFDDFWINYTRGTWDFFGLNHYTSDITTHGTCCSIPSRPHDSGVVGRQDPSWPSSASSWLKVVPWGFRKNLNWIASEYGNPPIFVTENGFSDRGGLDDTDRTNYFLSYLREMLKAIHIDNVNVIGYTAWSLLDNFEWAKGYTERFGLYAVNFTDPARPRTVKQSSKVLGEIARTNRLPPSDDHNTGSRNPASVFQITAVLIVSAILHVM